MPIPSIAKITILRGMVSAKVDLVRNGASVVVTVTFVAGLNYSGWTCYAEATAADAGKTVNIPKTITTDSSGRRVVTLTFTPATFYGLSGLNFDDRYVAYPRSFRIEAWHEATGASDVLADLFLGGTVTLTTAQPTYIHSVTQA